MIAPLVYIFATSSTPAPVHIRVDGEGLFRLARGMQAVYCSDLTLVNLNGLICSADGLPLLPQTRIPSTASFSVGMDGTLSSSGKQVGRVVLASFPAASLQKSGKYWTTNTRSQIGFPGDGILGIIRSGGPAFSTGATASSPKPASPATVEIGLKTEIDKPDIFLGDIATVQGSKSLEDEVAGIDLGAAPIFGAQRGITRGYVIAAMRHAGLDTDKINLLCPQGAFVVRKGQILSGDSILNAAKDGVKQQFGSVGDLRNNSKLTDLTVPTGSISITSVQAVTAGDGYTVNVEIDVDGKLFTRRTLSLDPINPAAKVRQGDPVKIRVVKNGATVQVQGKTRSAGRVGSTISVETEAGASFTGTLVSPSLVEVKF